MKKTNPESLALARDWDDTVERLVKTREKLLKIQSEQPDNHALGMLHLFYQTSLTYTTALAFYLHLRASEKYARKPELLRSHPIMIRLLTLKQSLSTLEDLNFGFSDSEDNGEDGLTWNADDFSDEDKLGDLEANELRDILADAAVSEIEVPKEPPRKKRKISQDVKPSNPVFDLIEPEFHSSNSPPHISSTGPIETYGEATILQFTDAADKTERKRTLRFHASKIESKSARRQGAKTKLMGGDDDIPYRERRKEKETRLMHDAGSKARGQGGEDLDDTKDDPTLQDLQVQNGDLKTPDGYYELVKKKGKERKEHKKAEYEAKYSRLELDDTSMGPRSLTRAILANKGLTPHRPKSVRNPRVKKRVKYDKAKKKLSSQKAIFKGGLTEVGRYDGEKSGISKVIKSTRLG